jgi:hypothetical protein
VWQTGTDGLDWLDELVKAGKAIHLGGDGYPYWYTAPAAYLCERILDGPPHARSSWAYDVGDILLEGWEGKTTTNHHAISTTRVGEWLVIEVWDES